MAAKFWMAKLSGLRDRDRENRRTIIICGSTLVATSAWAESFSVTPRKITTRLKFADCSLQGVRYEEPLYLEFIPLCEFLPRWAGFEKPVWLSDRDRELKACHEPSSCFAPFSLHYLLLELMDWASIWMEVGAQSIHKLDSAQTNGMQHSEWAFATHFAKPTKQSVGCFSFWVCVRCCERVCRDEYSSIEYASDSGKEYAGERGANKRREAHAC